MLILLLLKMFDILKLSSKGTFPLNFVSKFELFTFLVYLIKG